MEIRRIVVYVDLSAVAGQAVLVARRLAASFGAELDLLRVVEDPLSAGFTAELSAAALPEVQDAMQAETEEWLSEVLDDPDGLDATLAMELGVAEEEIVKYARRRAVDLIVIGGGPRGNEDEGDEDRVADAVVGLAPCSVLIVREARWKDHAVAARDEAARDEADPAPDDEVSYDVDTGRTETETE